VYAGKQTGGKPKSSLCTYRSSYFPAGAAGDTPAMLADTLVTFILFTLSFVLRTLLSIVQLLGYIFVSYLCGNFGVRYGKQSP
jgi:hypothetical protein